ncbi:MAG TPA: hypothetical protein DEP38_25990, partial [Cyanobacteria bacterium UBA9226]|nr:hypothetical protein [Cyanobacteria bacterium UBA9226]
MLILLYLIRAETAVFPELVAQICQEFGAFQGCVWDPKLAGLHGRLKRIEESILDKSQYQEESLTDLSPPIEDSRDPLPPLLLRDEFDYRRVPDGVWWINFWDKIQVETIGLQRILTANWAQIIEQPKGALVLVATDEPTDVNNPEHLLRLGEIVSHLHLGELQEYHVIS